MRNTTIQALHSPRFSSLKPKFRGEINLNHVDQIIAKIKLRFDKIKKEGTENTKAIKQEAKIYLSLDFDDTMVFVCDKNTIINKFLVQALASILNSVGPDDAHYIELMITSARCPDLLMKN
ncbi:MAG: hypothetical protein NTZ67_03245 [Gammaproteobacteria bacterium]|nr:hypothetical protein [Gammaproteobacteria bacterium]